ncbi:dihydrofolate reductase family protein [Cyclobacterium qasimii]|uniref:Dihydrofolate reductase n=2 Tax=Cyclobacterium qasimii TaxID=1350429 RepID=S7X501_9BACT|nr:dihydrofolate reductase family protein [Cyclobacterium qasimii]EPR71148.1 Dihydrofolate reductase [Cyclobacterium qasimii M12-11B]GEO20675.1 dihydrofolate reductase [Cyclobacterium qasimii]
MRKIKLFIATSLNGKIAKPDGSVDWLEAIPNPGEIDHGYSDFYKSIDTTIQGNTTYKQIISWGIDFPYSDKKNYVFTRNKLSEDTDQVTFIADKHLDFVKGLKAVEGKDIWLIGGGQLNTMLLNEKLIDEIQVFVMPIVLTEGIELFESLPKETSLTLIETKTYATGAVEIKYKVV